MVVVSWAAIFDAAEVASTEPCVVLDNGDRGFTDDNADDDNDDDGVDNEDDEDDNDEDDCTGGSVV